MSNSIDTSQSRKRKQPINDSSLIPTKRSTSIEMLFPKLIPSNDLIVMPFNNSKLISSQQYDIEQEQLKKEINELRRKKFDIQHQYESTMETIKRCLTITRSLLVEKCQLEKKEVRKKVMENRLRLGQFVTQRQGITFVEQWIDGYEFSDKQREKEQLIRMKENLDKERKILTKKKLFIQQQLIMDTMIDQINSNNSHFNSQDINNSIYVPPKKVKRTNKNSTIKTSTR